MRCFQPLSVALAWGLACLLTPVAISQLSASQQSSPQRSTENWIGAAHQLGGSGTAPNGSYVRLIPSRAWQPSATPPMWLAFGREGGQRVVRGTIPVLRERSPFAVEVLAKHLPATSEIAVRESSGKDSPHVHVRFQVFGAGQELAAVVREVFEQIEPGALARIDTAGTVVKTTFECVESLVVRTDDGEHVDTGKLPAAVARVGARVRLVATRKGSRGRFYYYGGVSGHWTTEAAAVRVTAGSSLPTVANRLGHAEWLAACRKRARLLVDAGIKQQARVATPLATGFAAFTDQGSPVCPRCHQALENDQLLSASSHDRVEAALSCCVRDQLFFLGHHGFDHGPFRSFGPDKEIR